MDCDIFVFIENIALTKGWARDIFSKIPLSRLSEVGKEKRAFHVVHSPTDDHPHPKCGYFYYEDMAYGASRASEHKPSVRITP